MSRVLFPACAILLFVLLAGGGRRVSAEPAGNPAVSHRPPNLLFIICDEVRADALGFYGNKNIQTPNLDKLAASAIVFDHAYDTQPLCTPNRAALLAGLYPHTSGCLNNNIRLPAGTLCLPEMLKGSYETGYFGKWHLGDEIFAQHGFKQWRSIEDQYSKYYSDGHDKNAKSDYMELLVKQGTQKDDKGKAISRSEATRLPEPLGKPAFLADEAIKFIRGNKDKPFVLYVSMLEPHMPFFGPRDGQYDPAKVTLPANFNNPPTDDQPLKTRILQQNFYEKGESGLKLKTEENWRRLIANYWGLCSLVDTHIGRMLDTLVECGVDDNTIVVFTTDHGEMMGSHKLVAKSVQFQEATRVPLIIRIPGRKGQRVAGPVSHINVVPTLLDLMGQAIPQHLQGKSLRPVIDGQVPNLGDVFIEWNSGDAKGEGKVKLPKSMEGKITREEATAADHEAVRTIVTTDGWKLNANSTRDENELYNLNDDPGETHNLVKDPKYQPMVNDLLGRIRAWQQKTGDKLPLRGA